MNPETVLITGSNRGIGLQLVKDFLNLSSPPKVLIAACRNPDKAQDLKDLATRHEQLKIIKLDILNQLDEASLQLFEQDVRFLLKGDSLNLLVNNAGVATELLNECSLHVLSETFTVNAFGPLLLAKTLMPLLKNAASQSPDRPVSLSKAGIINVSSRGGSIQDNGLGGMYDYRGSKSAMNMFTKNLSLEYAKDDVLILIIEPGPVLTDMSAPIAKKQEGQAYAAKWQTTEESVQAMMKVMVKCGKNDQGKYYSYKGEEIPW